MDIGTFEAKTNLSALLDRVEQGEEITITRRGKPVAKLVPAIAQPDRSEARAAAERIRERARGIKLGDVAIKELIEEGRH